MDYSLCLEHIVGLSQSKCECYEVPAELVNTSTIDRFLDDEMYSVPLSFTNTKLDCDTGGLWDVLQNARTKGLQLYTSLLSRTIESRYQKSYSILHGRIGEKTYSSTIQARPYHALILKPRKYQSTQIQIDYFDFYMTAPGTMDLEIVNMNDDTVIYYQSITSVSATFSHVPAHPIVLPFSDAYGRQINYMIRYSGLSPRNNEVHCNCPNRNAWKKYILAYGVSGDTVQDLYTGTTQIYAQGISLQFNYSCNYDWMCAEYDWRTGFGKTHAETAFLCCVVELLTVLLNRATPFTPAPPEYISEKKNVALAMIEDNIDWLAENLPRDLNHCTNCKKSRIGVGEVLV